MPARAGGPPADNASALRLLGKHQALTAPTAESMRLVVGFRNVLVNDYVDVDDTVVLARLQSLGDLDQFVREVAEYVERA